VDYDVTVDWMEIGNDKDGSQMLKVAIPTGIGNGKATAEIPFGDIERPFDGKEYPMLKWIDVSNADRGVTVLNDCKYGYDVQPDGTIRVTLLRAPYAPDPVADVGVHHMQFAILPHDGSLDRSAAIHEGDAFNKPLVGISKSASSIAAVPTSTRPMELSACRVDALNVIVTSVKHAEDGDGVVVRAYECAGKQTEVSFEFGFDMSDVKEVDLVERDYSGGVAINRRGRSISTTFSPYEIRTFHLTTR
jgi:alpha-mannosidase